MNHSLAFIVRTKGFEDERIINDDAPTASSITEQQKMNLLFNVAIRIALHTERRNKDSYILLFGTKIIAQVHNNKLFWTLDKPKHLTLMQRSISHE